MVRLRINRMMMRVSVVMIMTIAMAMIMILVVHHQQTANAGTERVTKSAIFNV